MAVPVDGLLWIRLDGLLAGARQEGVGLPDPLAVFAVLDRYREAVDNWIEGLGLAITDDLELTDLAMRLLSELAAGRGEADDPPKPTDAEE
ncbi:MAG TPA: hypothetical protein DCY40_05945 [Actinobacteria bacterium]|nr:hypothetical protein [Actinomycetota bacterium]